MIFRYQTREVNKKRYIAGSAFVAEKGDPAGEYEFPRAFTKDLVDEDGKLQWTIRENPDYGKPVPEGESPPERYLIEYDPEPLTPEEQAAKEKRAKLAELRAVYAQEKVLELQDAAIGALARGEALPQDYQDYVSFKKSLGAEVKRGKQ